MFERPFHLAKYQPEQNVALWLHKINTMRLLRQWPDDHDAAVAEASLCMGDVALTWLVTHCTPDTSWGEFQVGTKARFGDTGDTIMTRIQHRQQYEDESVQSYADDMTMLVNKSALPDSLKRDMLLKNLKPSLQEQVMVSIPTTSDQVIANATFLEEKAACVAPETAKIWEPQSNKTKRAPLERLITSMDKMSTAYTTLRSIEQQRKSKVARDQKLYQNQPRQSARRPLPWPDEHKVQGRWQRDCTPSTPEALLYANRLKSSNLMHIVSQREPYSDKTRSANNVFAKFCTVVSGSGAEQNEVRNSRRVSSSALVKPNSEAFAKCCQQSVAVVLYTLRQSARQEKPALHHLPRRLKRSNKCAGQRLADLGGQTRLQYQIK